MDPDSLFKSDREKSSGEPEWTLYPQKVVLDTSLFVNPDVRKSFGDTTTEALEAFLFLAAQIHVLEFYMPPSVFKELLNFVEKDKIPPDLLLILHQKPPKKHELKCPAFLLYELIEDIRERVNKGLRIAEKAVRGVEKRKIDEIIQDMRRKYREALREGIIDSKEDVDLLLLAMELDALLITADQGLIKWAEKLGIKWLIPEKFRDFLNETLQHKEKMFVLGHVSEVMTKTVITVRKNTLIKEAVTFLSENKISGLPIVDEENHVLGMITEADILARDGEKVEDIMTSPALTTTPDTDIRDVARILNEKKIKRLPVIDNQNKIIGIISRADIMKAVGK